MTVLALETSCDETAVAILRVGDDHSHELLASEVASQVAAHEKFGGIVPEIASRNHLIYAPRLLDRAIRGAGIEMSVVDAFAATSGPGLASSLMIGASIAKGLAIGFGKPYLAVNHLEGHLLSPFFGSADGGEQIKPNVSLIVSGGHTMSVLVRGLEDYELIGRSLVDVVAEPLRSDLIPGFAKVKQAAQQNGALGCGISGSGPTIFCLCKGKENAQKAGSAIQKEFNNMDLLSEIYIAEINRKGAYIIE